MKDDAFMVIVLFIVSVIFGIWIGIEGSENVVNSDCKNYGHHVTEKYKLTCELKRE